MFLYRHRAWQEGRLTEENGGIPVLVHVVSWRARGLRLGEIPSGLPFFGQYDVAFPRR